MVSQYPSEIEEKSKKIYLVFILLIVVIFSVIIFYIIIKIPKPETKPICGDAICEKGENEYNCCSDCTCSKSGEVCNYKTNACVKRGNANICGDGICDFGEDVWNCCIDCRYCPKGMICDSETAQCVYIEINITDTEAISLFKEFLINYGYNPQEVNEKEYVVKPDVYENEPAKFVCTKSELPANVVCGYLLENRTIIGPIQYW
jgi:hypothetical protein